MSNDYERLDILSLGGGDAISQVNEELSRAVLNILDINTDPSATRTVTLTIKIKSVKGKERQEYLVEHQASSKLQPDAAGIQPLYLAKGVGYVPRLKQMSFDDAFDPDTGEVTKTENGVTPITTAKNGDGER